MLDRITKLMSVKSLVTLAMCGVFCFLACENKISSEQFMTIFSTVIAFYFGTQATKEK